MASFEKATGRLSYNQVLERELAELVDKRTGRLSPRFSKTVNCPLCGEKPVRQEELFGKRGYSFVRCSSCRLIFANPQVKPQVVSQGFKNKSFEIWSSILDTPVQRKMDQQKYEDILELLTRYRRPGRLLDIGYNGGHFASATEAHGWQSRALELTPPTYKAAKRQLAEAVSFHSFGTPLPAFEKPFHTVTMLEVLEHFPEPLSFLAGVRSIMQKNGLLFLLLPNVESLAARVLRERAALFDGRYQLVFFSPSTISAMLKRAGFRVVYCDTIYTSLQPVARYLSWNDPYSSKDIPLAGTIKSLGMTIEAAERWIIDNNLGYKIRIAAKAV